MESFNWVQARAGCSLKEVFLTLAEVLDSDVKAMMATGTSDTFELKKPAADKLIVIRKWDAGGIPSSESVVFTLERNHVDVKTVGAKGQTPLFTARPSFTPDGECRLQVDAEPEPLEFWQVSRKALERLFFS